MNAKQLHQIAQYQRYFTLDDQTYLLNHSVGKPLASALENFAQQYFIPWQQGKTEPWPEWLTVIQQFKNALALLFNSKAENFCPQSNVSTGLTKLLMAHQLIHQKSCRVLLSEHDFPSMGFVFQKAMPENTELVFIPSNEDVSDFAVWQQYLTDDIDIVFITHAYSNLGVLSPIEQIINWAKHQGVISILDVAQSAGVVPIDLTALSPDFVIGSSVKWLCGGPGAAFLWVNDAQWNACYPKDVGWFSHKNPFEFDIHHFEYHTDATKFWGGTPAVAPFVFASQSIEFFAELGVETVRAYNQWLLAQLIESFPENLVLNLPISSRSGTLVLHFHDKQSQVAEYLKKHQIAVDERKLGLRVSPHIYNQQEDINRLIKVINAVI
jgi:selenocysteine lyase/cysteine desulfurase